MPLLDLASSAGQLGFEQLAGPFGEEARKRGPGAQYPSAYEYGKKFIVPDKETAKFGNGITSFDDPTYLGFSLRFDISSPLFNGVDGTIGSESAVGYLQAIGQNTRADYLKGFIRGIQAINRDRPYYWQTIEGLTDAYNKTFQMADPFSGSADGEGITIGCLEAIDLKISALFTLYKLACYDVKYKRIILPKNLMYFNVYVDIQEIRKFQTFRNFLRAAITQSGEAKTSEFVNENTSQITFKFTDCVWNPSESGKVLDGVTNAGGNEFASSSMKWSFSNIEIESQFSGFDSKLADGRELKPDEPNPPLTFGEQLLDTVKKFGKDQLNNAADSAISLAQRSASAIAGNIKLGNVFGLRNQIIGTLGNAQTLLGAAAGAAVQEQTAFGDSPSFRLGGNPLGEGVQPNNSLPTSKIFSAAPSGPSLGSSNIFGK